ncbi:MAG: hypothetical protein KKD01_07815 [Proteobacteria bacterium]|nr:hypothetical protein [Pseudomonadota bacterium]MBU1419853.1 hypothetical protein [Pseudomonadota bacterium]MBU1454624.1 hypothetical protein [Pseudomonadota bacterium]
MSCGDGGVETIASPVDSSGVLLFATASSRQPINADSIVVVPLFYIKCRRCIANQHLSGMHQ